MLSGDLYDLFRSDVNDMAAPYLWTDTEIYTYMNDAYRMFARLTGGIPDTTSAITVVPVVAGQATAVVSPLILRFRLARLVSTGRSIEITNQEELTRRAFTQDYGLQVSSDWTTRPGAVRYMVIGEDRSQAGAQVQWVQVPVEDDSVQLSVYRLPLSTIDVGDSFFAFADIGLEHVEHLLLHMKARAYGKQDAETFDRGRRDQYKAEFAEYCKQAAAEWERYKHKTRVVQYGG
jgi:hypothetical protein